MTALPSLGTTLFLLRIWYDDFMQININYSNIVNLIKHRYHTYIRTLWRTEKFSNLASDHKFAKVSSAKILCSLPYTAKLSSGKPFAVVHKIHYSLENFRSASGRGHHVLYTASDSRGKLSQSTEKCEIFPTRKFYHMRY